MEFKMLIKICKKTVIDVINSSGLAEISIHSANKILNVFSKLFIEDDLLCKNNYKSYIRKIDISITTVDEADQ